ncbi:MAG: hypothetical protein SP1CHLAM54_13740 [Chlamydiia bacterium]|nr:hypothetical protein [Chlamydiia bacterium]MCH9616267.1 hypothetical protein [Chlamydiia bacterium]MCH9629747.1 hypothetical protein [Chlamydiia bacterium]
MKDERQKMCWNCDADVSVEATYCPFCGTDLMATTAPPLVEESDPSSSVEESIAALYKPPYTSRQPETRAGEQSIKHSDFYEDDKKAQRRLGGGWALIFLSLGTYLLTFGLLLLFLSSDGKLTLEWNARVWFIYCVIAFPLIVVGFRLLSPEKKEGSGAS